MHIYRTAEGILLKNDSEYFLVEEDWEKFINDDDLLNKCLEKCSSENAISNDEEILQNKLLKPCSTHEIWGTGVTYYNSKLARQEEAQDAGGGDFYARVYVAERPEIFFKSTADRAVGHLEKVRIRKDSSWDVPEPELALFVSSSGKILGYTVSNDMSSRDIEGENPLYLPQAKTYNQSAAMGPCLYVPGKPIDENTQKN